VREQQHFWRGDIFVRWTSPPVLAINEAFINIQITSAGVNVRDAAVDMFQDFSRFGPGHLMC
jgi:hypothetical protein